jgi:hypothetical protein
LSGQNRAAGKAGSMANFLKGNAECFRHSLPINLDSLPTNIGKKRAGVMK